jgi:hypothetical protein
MRPFDEIMVGFVTLAIVALLLTNTSVKTLITNGGNAIASLTGVILK